MWGLFVYTEEMYMSFKPNGTIADEHLFQQPPERDNSVIVVVDGDEVAYMIAAACETRGVVIKNTSTGAESEFKNKTQFLKLLKGIEYPDGLFSITETQVAEPAKNAYSTIKKRIEAIKNRFNTNSIETYVGGEDNFRDSLPLPVKYKGNRDDTMRPILLDSCKEYLLKYAGAELVTGYEVDDKQVMRQWEGYTNKTKIINLSRDKDSKGCMGWLANPDDKNDVPAEFIEGLGSLYIDDKKKVRGSGRIFLYFQVIVGDSADNYNPRDLVEQVKGKKPRFGEKAAYDLLSPCTTDKECLQAVHDLYLSWFGAEQFSYTTWDGNLEEDVDYITAFQLYFDCARMLRWEGDKVLVRDMLTKMGVL
jgi:hypothetical protein